MTVFLNRAGSLDDTQLILNKSYKSLQRTFDPAPVFSAAKQASPQMPLNSGVTQFPNLLDVGPVRWSRKAAYSVIGTEPFVTFPLSAASDIAAVSSSSICRCEWGSIRCNPDIDSLARR